MTRLTAVRAALAPDHETVWASLAPLMAARGRMRVSRDGGRNYRARDERNVTDRLPNQPAALLIYDRTGCAPIICLDLDSSRGGAEAVERDFQAITRTLSRAGARWFSDRSPNQGRHVYIPVSEPVPFHEAKVFVTALRAQTPTLDPLPMLNIHAGCIRPPGARHRSGGHQALDGSISAAVDAIQRPTGRAAWRRLLDAVAASPQPTQESSRNASDPASANKAGGEALGSLDPLRGYGAPDEEFSRIARTGEVPSKYATPSEARQAVVWAAVASGWTFTDVARRVSDGTWPGLASFYARYSSKHRHAALVRDWRAAIAFETRRRERGESQPRNPSVHESTTSPHKTQAGAPSSRTVNREVRVWLAAVDLLTRRETPAVRAVLYALGEAAALTGDLVVEHGNRSLAIATGLDQSTVGRILRFLRDQPSDRLLIDQVQEAEGVKANSYALVVPPLLRPACDSKPWRRGRIHAVRPVFRELGMIASFVYAALEQADEAMGAVELASVAGVGRSAGHEALLTLAAWGLAERKGTGWVLGQASITVLAEQLGVDEKVRAQIAKYRAERVAWWRYLGLVERLETVRPEPEEPPPDAVRPIRPWEDEAALLALLAKELGAELIA